MSEIRISILLDNNTLVDQYFLGEPGFSAFLEADGKRFLFDTGYSDAFLQNAQKLNIDLLSVDFIIFSHGHLDHTWGLLPLIRQLTERDFTLPVDEKFSAKQVLIAHPDVFTQKYIESSSRVYEIGNVFSMDSLNTLFDVKKVVKPLWLSEHVLFLGEIPRETSFESVASIGKTADGADELRDDTALAIVTTEGLVILTGCSHAGICNIVQYAQRLTGVQKIRDIVGGFHLLNPSEDRLAGTVKYLQQVNPKIVHACHCTDLRSKFALSSALPIGEIGSGMVLTYS